MKNNKILLSLVGVYLLYCFLLAVIAPIFIKPLIAEQTKPFIKGEVSIEGLSINPFTHTLNLKGFILVNAKGNKLANFDTLSVNIDLLPFIFFNADIHQLELIGLEVFTGAGEKNPWLQLPELTISDTTVALAQQDVYIKNVIAEQLTLSVVLNNAQASNDSATQSNNIELFVKEIEQLLINESENTEETSEKTATETVTKTATKTVEESAPWLIHIAQLRINAGKLSVLDQTIRNERYSDGITTVITPINIELASIESDLSRDIKLNLDAELFKGKLNIKGNINPATLASQLNYSIEELQLSELNAYVEHFSLVSIISGSFSTQGEVESLQITQENNTAQSGTATRTTTDTTSGANASDSHVNGSDVSGSDLNGSDISSDLNTENISSEKSLQVKVANSSQVKMLAVKHQNFDTPLLNCETIETKNLNYVLLPSTLTLDSVLMQLCTLNPYINSEGATNFNFAKIIETEQQTQDASNASNTSDTHDKKAVQPASHSINIKLIELINNAILIEDFSQGKQVTLHLKDLQAKLENLAEGKTDLSTYQLSALLNNHAPLSIQGNGNFLNPKLSAKGNIHLKNLGLKEFSPYALKLISRPIKKGVFAMDIDINVLENNLNSHASLNLLGIDLGKKQDIEGASQLPIGLALSLLKDSKGDIHIKVPIKGNLDNPTFSINEQIIKTLTSIISKAAMSPLSMVGNLITGTDNTDSLKIIFTEQTVTMDDSQQKIISKVADVLKNSPELSLHLSAFLGNSSLDNSQDNSIDKGSLDSALNINEPALVADEIQQVELLNSRQQAVYDTLITEGVSELQLNKLPIDITVKSEKSHVLLDFFAR